MFIVNYGLKCKAEALPSEKHPFKDGVSEFFLDIIASTNSKSLFVFLTASIVYKY